MDKEVVKELEKMRIEESLIKEELNLAKQKMIKDLDKSISQELKSDFGELNKPIKIKKPLRLKIKEFFNRISKVLGN